MRGGALRHASTQIIKPTRAVLSGKAGAASIEVFFEPTPLPTEITSHPEWQVAGYNNHLESTLWLDFINLETLDLAELAGQTLDFPTNPADGYIDGSFYLCAAHNPVDARRISFGRLRAEAEGGGVPVTFYTHWDMEFEGTPFSNFEMLLHTTLYAAT